MTAPFGKSAVSACATAGNTAAAAALIPSHSNATRRVMSLMTVELSPVQTNIASRCDLAQNPRVGGAQYATHRVPGCPAARHRLPGSNGRHTHIAGDLLQGRRA